MYPISAKQNLTLLEIARHWSREITPPMKEAEVLDGLIEAWWRSELIATQGPSRADMLRVIYKTYQDRVAFTAPGLEESASTKALPDGGLVVFRLWQVPLPNAQPNSWDDTNCEEAFEAVANAWSSADFNIVMTSIAWIELTPTEFKRWTNKNGYRPTTFWGIEEERLPISASLSAENGPSPRRRGPKPKKLDRVKRDMRRDIEDGELTAEGLQDMAEKNLESTYGVSRDTARKARRAVLSEIVNK